jgi:hypothetical protein
MIENSKILGFFDHSNQIYISDIDKGLTPGMKNCISIKVLIQVEVFREFISVQKK